MHSLRIAIATAGRFHLLDVARELHCRGHHVRFYSYVPKRRAARFGLPLECHVSLLPFVFPFVVWERYAPRLAPSIRERLMYIAINAALILKLERCDIFHAMSGIFLEAAAFAKRKYGARVWLVRASRHIADQDQILAGIPGAVRPTAHTVQRETAGYVIADRIAVPSKHAGESFARDPAAHMKVVVTPFGVDLGMFPQRSARKISEPFVLLNVGLWSLQKGCDILAKAIGEVPGACLRHIGTIVDLPFPKGERFEHHQHVAQWDLAEFYASADVFVLASHQEGLAIVLCQALASGLPVICTDRTGGADLAHTPALKARITIVPHGDYRALTAAIESVRAHLLSEGPLAPLSDPDRATLSWRAFAEKYEQQMQEDLLTAGLEEPLRHAQRMPSSGRSKSAFWFDQGAL